MRIVPLAAVLIVSTMLCAPSPVLAQTPSEQTTKTMERGAFGGCKERPAGHSLRLVCPMPGFLPDDDSDEAGPPPVNVVLKLPEGTPLRIAVDERTRVSRVGETVHGHVVEAVYAFDEPVVPAGTIATGQVTEIIAVSAWRRARSYANGDFSPFHAYKVTFDRLLLPGGRELAIETTVAPGATEVVHLVSKAGRNQEDKDAPNHKNAASRAANSASQEVTDRVHEASASAQHAADEIRAPGKMHRLKEYLWSQTPYRHQYVSEGTRFSASLNRGLDFGSTWRSQQQLSSLGSVPEVDTLLHARLLLEVSSATALRGNPVVAQLTEPVYSADHRLLLPSESRLIGRVLEARPARSLHRNGELRLIFEHIELPGGALQPVQGTLEGMEVDRAAHLKLDEEGGARATDSKSRYLQTGLALALAAAAAHPDVERGGLDQSGDPAVRAGSGASGFGLAGTVIGLASKSNVVSIVFSAYGASNAIYTNFLSRGHDVVLPKNAPLEIGLGTTHPSGNTH